MKDNKQLQTKLQPAETPPYRTYKDRVFRILYKDRKRLLELYNALNDTHYVVFYNGTERNEEEFIQRLSDAFEDGENTSQKIAGCIELTVKAININFGHNNDLLERCESLYGYAYFVAAVRRNLESMSLSDAAERAVNECIEKNVLRQFFSEQKRIQHARAFT